MGAITPALLEALNRFAASRGLSTVEVVLNSAGANKTERGKLLPFEPRLYWIEKDNS